MLGPIRTRGDGNVETTTISNSDVQAIRTSNLGPITKDEVMDPDRLERELQLGLDPVSHAAAQPRTVDRDHCSGHVASPPLAAPLAAGDRPRAAHARS